MLPISLLLAAGTTSRWLATTWAELAMVLLSTAGIFAGVIFLTRLAGLRSFSQMSAFDFAMTVAIGSLVASTASGSGTTLLNGLAALAVLYVVQIAVARARLRWGFSRIVDNTPLLLMYRGRVLEENLERARVAERDLWAKLRQQGLSSPDQALAVVFETTADVSIIQGDGPLDPRLLEHVRGVPEDALELS